ncbi:Stk1 family PASTA domain-containing Ser/Thr kinase [Nocardioides rubriscoriae]|uniref:Stk1 family PASTA domain-containing Ser/Thr kinase n=1 Tax=Nocardioides rubriscoriae TaxID=642762 RepID=UPI0011E06E4D|nr:Stk1 family PASTA domain-containing Ser/Thr kinase [Nocardioides rubriscoriae]
MNDDRSDQSGPTVVGGRYELGELLGRGGMAEVRKGTDSRLGRIVAVKRLRTDLASDATFQARFRREAQSSASLNHPSIVAVYDTGEEPAGDGSGIAQPYIVMEFVAGRTLRDILREGRKILPERALEITSGVLSALDYSHRAGIIHRDIKPGNVMLTPSGDVKVMDFGIARAMSDAANSMTQTAAVVGTAQYLSPEQARGEQVDSRSDVYSAGCLLYELLTGRPPFVGDSPVAVAYQHVREQADPPSDHDTDLPPAVDAIVMKSLAKRLEDRYQSAAAMRADIEAYLAGRPVQAVVPVPVPEPVRAAPVPVALPTAPRRPEPALLPVADSPPRTGLWVVLGLLLVALLVAGWFLVKDSLFPDSPDRTQVPSVIGMTEQQARTAIGDAGLAVREPPLRVNSDTVPSGDVIDQAPQGDDYVDPGSEVTLTISIGEAEVTVPDVTNKSVKDAIAELKAAGFTSVTKQVEESDLPAREVLRQDPAGGSQVQKGTTITLFYSDGMEQVPDVVGDTQEVATAKIQDAGFTVDVREGDETDVKSEGGKVTDQVQPPGQVLPEGSIVTIFVAVYVEPTAPPTSDAPTTSAPPTDVPPTTVPTTLPSPRRGVAP